MKKSLSVAITCLLLTASAFAQSTQDPAIYELSLQKNGTALWDGTLPAVAGQEAGMSRTSAQEYVKDCKPNEQGGSEFVMDKLITGTRVALTPLARGAQGDELIVYVNHSLLLSMKTLSLSPKCTVSSPSLRSFSNSATVKLKHGERIEFPAVIGDDKYVLIVRSL